MRQNSRKICASYCASEEMISTYLVRSNPKNTHSYEPFVSTSRTSHYLFTPQTLGAKRMRSSSVLCCLTNSKWTCWVSRYVRSIGGELSIGGKTPSPKTMFSLYLHEYQFKRDKTYIRIWSKLSFLQLCFHKFFCKYDGIGWGEPSKKSVFQATI